MTILISVAMSVSGGSGGPPLPDLTGAEPQVRAAIMQDHDAIVRDPGVAGAWGWYAARLAVHEYLLEAVVGWQRAQGLDGQDFRWPYLTGVFLSQDDPEAAIDAFERALRLNDRYPPLQLRYAAMMERLGRPTDALRAYRRAVELAPRNPYAHAGLGGRLLDDGKTRQARRHLELALQLDPSCRPALTWLVAWYRQAGQLDRADELAQRAAAAPKARPPDAVLATADKLSVGTNAVMARAEVLTSSGHLDQAIEILSALVAANPASARGRTELGDRLREQGRLPAAQDQYRAALELIGDLLPARLGLAQCLVLSDRLDEARQEYERSLAEHPTSYEAHSGLAVCLASMGRIDLAAKSFRAALKLAPESRRSRIGYGRALLLTDRPRDALVVLRPIVESVEGQLDELAVDALALTGLAWSKLGRTDEALDTLRRALRAAPKRADVRGELAGILAGAGRAREATNLLRDGIALQPDDAGTALGLAWILATSPDAGVRDGAMAVQLTERWLNAPGQARDGSRLDILACAYAEAGRFEDAAQAAERAIDMATKAGKPELAEAMTVRLELFRQRRAFRDR